MNFLVGNDRPNLEGFILCLLTKSSIAIEKKTDMTSRICPLEVLRFTFTDMSVMLASAPSPTLRSEKPGGKVSVVRRLTHQLEQPRCCSAGARRAVHRVRRFWGLLADGRRRSQQRGAELRGCRCCRVCAVGLASHLSALPQ